MVRYGSIPAGYGSSRETLAGRALAALKSQGLLNAQIGAGSVDRKWPPALLHTSACPLSSLRQGFLVGSLTRLLGPEDLLRSRIINGWKPARSAAPREAVGACRVRAIGRTKARPG